MEPKTEPGLHAPPANRNWIDPDVEMTSQEPGTNPGQFQDKQQTTNRAPVSRQQQQQLLQGSPRMPLVLPGGPSGATIPQMPRPSMSNSNPMPGSGGTTGTLQIDMYSIAQTQQPQQLTSQNQMLYHQQQLALRYKLQQQQQQQQQQSLLQAKMQMSSALAGGSGMMSIVPTGGMQQSQMNSAQQRPVGQGGSFQQLTLMQQQPQTAMQNATIPTQQTDNVVNVQQQQLQMQQNQMQRSLVQQNQLQQNRMQQNQMLLGQQQNQMMGSWGGSMNNMQRQMQMQRQAGLLQQQHLLSQLQSQQQQLAQQQQPSMMQQREMQIQQQPVWGSSALLQTQNSTAIDPQSQQQQQFIPQQQPQQQQRAILDGASGSASMDSTAQTGNPGDWQEEIYQKLEYLKDTYLADLREIHQKLSIKLSQLDDVVLANARGGDQVGKMEQFKLVLERMMAVLQLGKQGLHIGLKDKLALYEKQILSILQNHKKVSQRQPQSGVTSAQLQSPPLKSQPRKCKVCEDCVHKRRNS